MLSIFNVIHGHAYQHYAQYTTLVRDCGNESVQLGCWTKLCEVTNRESALFVMVFWIICDESD